MPFDRIPLGSALLNFLFPPLCYSCGCLVGRQTDTLCPACRARMRPLGDGDPLVALARLRLCADGCCRDLVSAFRFERDGPVQALLHALKYRGGGRIGRSLGEEVGSRVLERAWASGLDLVIPMPLHRAKHRERGYNQAEQCALGMARVLGLPVHRSAVRRVRWTRSQTALGFAERQENVREAFRVPRRARSALRGRTVLLVDDVITTGATVRACASALSVCKPAGLYVASIALAEP